MIKFLLGESRELKFEISNRAYPDFAITSATYHIIRENVVIDSGSMDISGHFLTVSFTPEEHGYHWLEITYIVGPDTMKARYKIDVD